MGHILIINGAPAVGKTTISSLLREKFDYCPHVDFGSIRVFHLNREWSNKSENEEEMSYENLLFILNNYLKHGYQNGIVDDLRDDRALRLYDDLGSEIAILITLVASDETLAQRIINPTRDSGFKDLKKAQELNKQIKQRARLENEIFIETDNKTPEEVVVEIVQNI
jgi:broad-specificity NMP kinase